MRRRLRRIRDAYWSVSELGYGLRHGPHRRYIARNYLCVLGLHWPIQWWDVHGGSERPYDPDWACCTCGKVKEPYRALWWRCKERAWRVAHG